MSERIKKMKLQAIKRQQKERQLIASIIVCAVILVLSGLGIGIYLTLSSGLEHDQLTRDTERRTVIVDTESANQKHKYWTRWGHDWDMSHDEYAFKLAKEEVLKNLPVPDSAVFGEPEITEITSYEYDLKFHCRFWVKAKNIYGATVKSWISITIAKDISHRLWYPVGKWSLKTQGQKPKYFFGQTIAG